MPSIGHLGSEKHWHRPRRSKRIKVLEISHTTKQRASNYTTKTNTPFEGSAEVEGARKLTITKDRRLKGYMSKTAWINMVITMHFLGKQLRENHDFYYIHSYYKRLNVQPKWFNSFTHFADYCNISRSINPPLLFLFKVRNNLLYILMLK